MLIRRSLELKTVCDISRRHFAPGDTQMFKLLDAIWARLDLINIVLLVMGGISFAWVILLLWLGKTDSRKGGRPT